MSNPIKIFLASSSELREEREAFEIFVNRENQKLVKRNLYLELIVWENLDSSVSPTRLQDEYNVTIQDCDIFVMLFSTKVGKYTEEEFSVALAEFKQSGKPQIYTYFKDEKVNLAEISGDILSMLKFKDRLDQIGHFYTTYKNIEGLILHFSDQLYKFFEDKYSTQASDQNNEDVSDATSTLNQVNAIEPRAYYKLEKSLFSLQNRELLKPFYQGAPPTWNVIEKGTFERDKFRKIIAYFKDQGRIAIINGAGGEGKSTLLMQVGLHYFKNNHEVYISSNSEIDIQGLLKNVKKNTLILIDEVNQVSNLFEFLKYVGLISNVKVLMTARTNEWYYFLSKNKKSSLIRRTIGGGEFRLAELSNRELDKLTNILSANEVLIDQGGKSLKQELKEEGNQFLLALMLKATKGKRLEYILEDVLATISRWENGFLALRTLGTIVSLEVKDDFEGANLYCPEKLLSTVLTMVERIGADEYHKIKQYLSQEAFIQYNTSRSSTRNILISKIFYRLLFKNEELSYLSEYEINSSILYAAVLVDDKYCKSLLWLIPWNFSIETDKLILSGLFEKIYGLGFIKAKDNLLQWLRTEFALGNIGDYEKKYSARWIIKLGFDRGLYNSKFIFQAFKIEESVDNIGDQDTEYSARWILKKGVEISNHYGSYLMLAKLEEAAGNIGDYDTEYSARWILKRAMEVSNNFGPYLKLAQIEEAAGNIGDYDTEYSARWILKRAMEVSTNFGPYLKLAEIEEAAGNLGDYDTEYSARWILKQAIAVSDNYGPYLKLAEIEELAGNLGDYDTAYSARWILKRAIEVSHNHGPYLKLAKIEEAAGNLGDYDTKYSARWILKRAMEVSDNYGSYLKLAIIEEEAGNIGDYNTAYSARWILKKGIESFTNSELYMLLADIEETAGNIGDYDTEYSARWILKRAMEVSDYYAPYLRLAKLEEAAGNIGDYDTAYSARWILKKGIEESNYYAPYLKLAELEEAAGNIGDYDTEYSARWILKKGIEEHNYEGLVLKLTKIEDQMNA